MTFPDEHNCGFPNWSTEIIQKVASHFTTPSQLLNYACICKRVNSAIGLREYLINDIQCFQANRSQYGLFCWTCVVNSNHQIRDQIRVPDRAGKQDVFKRPYLQMRSPGSYIPVLNWAIETGVDINLIKEIINTYSRICPGALNGLWHPLIRNRTEGDVSQNLSNRLFPSPMLVAARSGRLDVIKTLVESGVEIRKQNTVESIYRYDTSPQYTVGSIYRYDISRYTKEYYFSASAEMNAFALACEAGEEVAQFMILNGLDLRYEDLWWPVEFGRTQVLETLLQNPLFKTGEGQQAINKALCCLVYASTIYPIRDFSVIKTLLDTITEPTFDKIEWFESSTAHVLRNERSHYNDALSMYLFNHFKNSGTQSIVSFRIARQAARSDDFLEITKAILLEAERSRKARNGKGLSWIDCIMKKAITGLCLRTAMCIVSSGYRFPSVRLWEVIGRYTSLPSAVPCESIKYTKQLDLIDVLVNSGTSVNEHLGGYRLTLLEHALCSATRKSTTRDGRQGLDCRVALRLMHYGADTTKVREHLVKSWLEKLYYDKDLTDYFFHKISRQNDLTTPGREIFSQKISSVDSPLYVDQVYAMAVMMRGRRYLKRCLKKVLLPLLGQDNE